MLVYVTKYALTGGIFERDVELCHGFTGLHREVGVRYPACYRLGGDCFMTRDEAVLNAEKRRVAKIASVKKQLAKLEAMTF